jgi:hypothetical protein
MNTNKTLGQIAFEVYREAVDKLTYDNKKIPEWDGVTPNVQQGWEQAAVAIESAVMEIVHPLQWRQKFDARQQKLIAHAETYSKDPFGVDGHNALMVIAKLAGILDDGE